MSYFQGNSIFWIEVEKIKPNPYQPRKEFDEEKLKSLAESVRQYGVLQPLVVTRREVEKSDGGISVEYELIAGERRLRASKIAHLTQVPVIIKSGEEDALLKLELAIIENIQREDLNPIDRALAFEKLVEEFGFKHGEVGKKVGKSREYVSNTLRLLTLPEEIRQAVATQKTSEGHARTLMMLNDRPEEQMTVFKEIIYKNLTVRETEAIARRIAHDKVRKKSTAVNPEIVELEERLSESLGTRVQIEARENGGKILIDFFSPDDIRNIIALVTSSGGEGVGSYDMLSRFIESQKKEAEEGVQSNPEEGVGSLENALASIEEGSPKDSMVDNFNTEETLEGLEQHPEQSLSQKLAENAYGEKPAVEEGVESSSFPRYEDFEMPQAESPEGNLEEEGETSDNPDDEEPDDLYSVSNFTI